MGSTINLINGTHYSCEMREYVFMILQEYIIISRLLGSFSRGKKNTFTLNTKLWVMTYQSNGLLTSFFFFLVGGGGGGVGWEEEDSCPYSYTCLIETMQNIITIKWWYTNSDLDNPTFKIFDVYNLLYKRQLYKFLF